jgi:hypothetical protein
MNKIRLPILVALLCVMVFSTITTVAYAHAQNGILPCWPYKPYRYCTAETRCVPCPGHMQKECVQGVWYFCPGSNDKCKAEGPYWYPCGPCDACPQ